MEFSLKPTKIKSNKTGKEYDAFKLTYGDFEHVFFANGRMELNYLRNYLGEGVATEVKVNGR